MFVDLSSLKSGFKNISYVVYAVLYGQPVDQIWCDILIISYDFYVA